MSVAAKQIYSKLLDVIGSLKLELFNTRIDIQCEHANYARLLQGLSKSIVTCLEKSRDFQFDYIIQLSESTKRLIDIILSYKELKRRQELSERDSLKLIGEIFEHLVREILNLQRKLMNFTMNCFHTPPDLDEDAVLPEGCRDYSTVDEQFNELVHNQSMQSQYIFTYEVSKKGKKFYVEDMTHLARKVPSYDAQRLKARNVSAT